MKPQHTRFLAFVLALCMVMSLLNMAVPAATAEETTPPEAPSEPTVSQTEPPAETEPTASLTEENSVAPQSVYPTLTLGISTDAVIATAGETALFCFVPEESGYYLFQSDTEGDTYGYIYNAEMTELAGNDDSGAELNFCVAYRLEAGQTYYFGARYLSSDNTGSFPVVLVASPIAGISADPVTITDGTYGDVVTYYDSTTDTMRHYYCYEWEYCVSYTVTMKDGTVIHGAGESFEHDGITYEPEMYAQQSHEDPWTPGNTYEVTVFIAGTTIQIPVSIVESPISAITVDPVFAYYGLDGYWTYPYNADPYFIYTWENRLSYTVTTKDGSTFRGSGDTFTYDGETYKIGTADDQNGVILWEPENSYTGQIVVGSLTAPVEVAAYGSPITQISIEPITLKPYENGYMVTETTDGETVEYFYYRTWNLDLQYTVTFRDGTVVTETGCNVFFDGSDHSIDISDPQNAKNIWLPGNTYTVTASVLGVECDVQITIAELPFVDITVDPITLYGDLDATVNTDEQGNDWIYYDWQDSMTYTVTRRDGSTQEYDYYSFWCDGAYYHLEPSDSQSPGNVWLPGNTYTASVTVRGLSFPVSITITEPVVDYLTLDPITLTEGIDSYITTESDPVTGEDHAYAYYDWKYEVNGTIHFTNGKTLKCDSYRFTYDDKDYYLQTQDNQSYTTPWTGGNTYPVTLSIGEKEYSTTVTIENSPVVSVVAEPVVVYEDIHSQLASAYDSELGETVYYTRYNWRNSVSYTITFRDGSVVKGTGRDFLYDGYWYDLIATDTQSPGTPWEVGNSYTAQITILGATADVTVTVAENPVDRIVADPVYLAENTGGFEDSGYDSNGNYVDYFRYNWANRLTFTIYFNDGSTLRVNGASFFYDDIYQSASQDDSQSPDNPWIAGNTYLGTIEVFGHTAEVEVSIGSSGKEGRYSYTVVSGGAIITSISPAQEGEILEIPGTLGGYPVIGITSLGQAIDYAVEIMIPDSVTMLSDDLFEGYDLPLKKVQIGSGISWLSNEMFLCADRLESVTVSPQNPLYCSIDGVVYDIDQTRVVVYPLGKADLHQVPDSVTDVSAIFEYLPYYPNLNIALGNGVTDYVTVDGVIYSADMKTLYYCSPSKTGTYVMPDSVTEIASCGFANTGLTEITVSPNVTEIVYGVFMGSKTLQKVNLPDNLQSIGLYAFQYCTGLKSADIPASLTAIDSLAYDGCTGLEAVNIEDIAAWSTIRFSGYKANPLYYARDLYLGGDLVVDLTLPETGLDRISGYAFYNGSLTSVTIPGNVKSIGGSAFRNSDLTSARLSEGIERILASAFANTDLTAIDLPDSLTELDGDAFANCTALSTATIGSGLQEIGGGAFENTALTRMVIPENITYIGWSAFENSKLTEVVIENDSVEIGGYAFAYCPLKQINLGNGVSIIDECAFMGSHAAMVRLPDAVTDITYRSFAFSPNLMGVVIPAGVEYISTYAFEGDSNLSHVLYTGTEEQWNALEVESEELLQATLHCNAKGDEFTVTESCAKLNLYCAICQRTHSINKVRPDHEFVDGVCTVCGHQGPWEYEINTAAKTVTVTGYSGTDTAISIPSTIRNMPVTAIADKAFYGRKELTAITIPNTVTTIGNRAFYQCSGLVRMTLPDSVTKLGSYAFARCTSLNAVTLSENLTALEDYTFYACFELTSLRIPASVTKLGAALISKYGFTFTFCGDAPEFDPEAFLYRHVICNYPASNPTWTENVTQDYGGYDVEWNALDVIPPVLTGKGFSLSFEDEILVNFYYQISDTTNVRETGMAVFYGDPDGELDLELANECYTSAYDAVNQRYMSQTEGIAAKYMGDERYYVAYAVLTDGTIAFSPVYRYNPRQYALGRIANSSNSKLKALCVSMLNYGAAAQDFFGYRTDDLMNASLTAQQQALALAYDASLFTGAVAADPAKIGGFVKTSTGFSKKNASVSFEGAFAINYYFTPDRVVDGAMTFYYWTSEDYAAVDQLSPSNATGSLTLTDSGNGTYWATVDGIAAKHLDKTYYVAAVYYSDLALQCTGVISYSLSRYCMNNAKPGKSMESLASATAMYGYYARSYFQG